MATHFMQAELEDRKVIGGGGGAWNINFLCTCCWYGAGRNDLMWQTHFEGHGKGGGPKKGNCHTVHKGTASAFIAVFQ